MHRSRASTATPPARARARRAPSLAHLSAAGVAAVLLLGACGGGGGGADGVASLGAGAVSATATTVAGNDQDRILAYAACLRDQGLDVADPTFDADGNVQGGFFGPGSGFDRRSAEFQSAQEACGSLIEGVTFGGQGGRNFDPEQLQAATLAYTECLRDEGLEVDDLDISAGGGPGGGAGFGPGGQNGPNPPAGGSVPEGATPGGRAAGGPGGGDRTTALARVLGLDPEDPVVAAALEVCAPVLESAFTGATSTTEPS